MDLAWLMALLPESVKPIVSIAASLLVLLEVLAALPQLVVVKGLLNKAKALPVVASLIYALESWSLIKPKDQLPPA